MSKLYDSLIVYSIKLVAKKRYTVSEMYKKLRKRMKKIIENEGGDLVKDYESQLEEIIERVIIRLKELKYLNDEKFAQDFLSDKKKFRPKSSFLLTRDLKKKGLSDSMIKDALQKVEYDDFEAALELFEKRKHKWNSLVSWEKKAKAYRYLSSKGFRSDDIYKVLNYCYSQDE